MAKCGGGVDIRQVAVKCKACLETFDKAAGAAEGKNRL